MRTQGISMLAALVSVIGACGAQPVGAPGPEPTQVDARGPYYSDAEMRPDLLRVEPPAATPGAEVELHYPQETERAVHAVLESDDVEGWTYRYSIIIPAPSYTGEVRWYPAGEDVVWTDDALSGPGPDRIVIPDTAPPGQYRACVDAAEVFCAPLEVLEGFASPSE
jgi:hypothetical protein